MEVVIQIEIELLKAKHAHNRYSVEDKLSRFEVRCKVQRRNVNNNGGVGNVF